MGMKIPEPPAYSYTANALIKAYNTIARSRRYEQGTPLTISISDIKAYCDYHELPVDRYIFDAVVFELDNQFIDGVYKKLKKKST